MRANSFVFKIIALFLVLITLLVLSLNILYYKESHRIQANLMKENLSKLVKEKKAVLDLRLEQIELETIELGVWLSEYLQQREKLPDDLESWYFRDERGVLSNKKEENRTSLFLNNKTPLTEEIKKDIYATQKMEDHLIRLLQNNPNIVCTYMITSDGLLRVYPYLDNSTFEADHNFNKDTYYEIALEEKNPQRKPVWTQPYNDWAGRGWIVTCSYPVYVDGKLKAVVCNDVTLEFLQEATADLQVAKSGFGFLLDKEGNIIYHPEYIPQAKEKGEVLRKSLLKEGQNGDYTKIINHMVEGKTGIEEYNSSLTGSKHLISYAPIERIGWSIGLEVDRNEYILDLKNYFGGYFFIAFAMFFIAAILGSFFFRGISKPIISLSQNAEKIAAGKFGEVVNIQSRDEIGALATSLNAMSLAVKEHMENLIKSKTQLETVLNSIKGFLSIRSLDYRILMVNSAGNKFAQEKGKEIIGARCYEYFEGRREPCENCPMAKTLITGKEAFAELVSANEIFHVWSFPVFNLQGELEEIVVYSTNVTEKIVLEREFYQKEKLAGIGQIAAGVTHELKNPLAVIKGSAYLLREALKDEQLKEETQEEVLQTIKEIDNSVNRAEKIIYNLLDFSRRSELKKEKIDLASLIDQVLILEKKTIVEHDIETSVEFIPRPLVVYGILDSMKQVFLNLINNALDAMPNGGYLKIYGTEMESEGKVKIQITDTGSGISKEFQEQIFQPFFTTKPRGMGTGIGLWIVKNEIQKHGGEIQIISEEGKGTRVTIILPKNRSDRLGEEEGHV